MTKTTVLSVLAGLSFACASTALAQSPVTLPPQYYVNVNVGAQTPGHTTNATSTYTLYDEDGKLDATYNSRSGVLFDIGGGRRIWRNMTVGASYSRFGQKATGSAVATIPNPLFFDQPVVTGSIGLGELEHSEDALHVTATFWFPITDKIDVTVGAGPSFIWVTQQVATGVNVTPGTQNFESFIIQSQSGTAFGVNVGGDVNYMYTDHIGGGLFVRYAGGSVDLPNAPGLSVGGFQVGLGLRLRF